MKKRIIALALTLALILAGCGASDISNDANTTEEAQIGLEQTISSDSKWINSSIPGAINADTNVKLQDDFYTYVNKDTLVATNVKEDSALPLEHADSLVKQRKIMMVSGIEDPDANKEVTIDIPTEYVEHNEDLVRRFVAALQDWDTRNRVGRAPLEDYIKAITDISDLSQMTDYILDKNGDNFTNDSLISMEVQSLRISPSQYTVILGRTTDYLLESRDQYIAINGSGIERSRIVFDEVVCALTGIGYTENEAQKILKDCYKFEGKLADASLPTLITSRAEYSAESDDIYSYDVVTKLQGAYPLCDLMNKYGFDKATEYCIPYTDFVRKVGKLYSESNLEQIKAYYIVHTIHEAMGLLDEDAYNLLLKYEKSVGDKIEINLTNGDGDVQKVEINDEWDRILNKYVAKYLGEPFEMSYIARYCTPEDKEYLSQMTEDLTAYYVDMLQGEDWLSEETREAAIGKLNSMKRHILYPEYFTDYSDVRFEDDDTLVDMVKKINSSSLYHMAEKAGREVDPTDWDIVTHQSSQANAFYVPKENAIYIMSGMLAGGELFNVENPYECNLANIGTIVGHEISHGFDKNGICFDNFGNDLGWWKGMEMAVFTDRTGNLEKFYDSLPPAPGMANMTGSKLSNEAIADMGGMKATLGVSKKMSDFDYDLFFTSFAKLWCSKQSYTEVLLRAKDDEHPQPFLRVNVTLSQFDEFMETYDIKEGDGMYVAPENRIAVW